jgi:hypothetical protein
VEQTTVDLGSFTNLTLRSATFAMNKFVEIYKHIFEVYEESGINSVQFLIAKEG